MSKLSQWALVLTVLMASVASVRAEDSSNPVIVLLFMFMGLIVGVLVMQVLSRLGDPIPYTVVIFIAGLVFSLAHKGNAGLFGDSVTDWVNIDADLLLFTFLPPLLFGEAMNLNYYHFQGAVAQSSLLAGPGVLIGAALLGVIAKYLLPYNWSWDMAMTFGSSLAATDTVAMVALLGSANASPKLTMLIVAESLLNDGTAMVLFTVFFEAVKCSGYTGEGITLFFIAATVGSMLFGMATGFLIVRWLRTAHRPLKEIDTTIQIAITIACAYLIFFIAQYVLGISGPLAVCWAGVMLAWLAPPIILNHDTMHNVWGMIEWSLNTLIFMLAGLIIGNRVIDKVAAIDWLYLVLLYLALVAVRSVVIFLLYPWLSTWGHKCTKNEAVFMTWAGLRGALSMALGLLVEHNCPDDLKDEASRMFFYIGGVSALTMLINATTAQQLLTYLGLMGNDSAEKHLVMQQIKKRLKRRMDSVLVELAAEFAFTEQDLDEVRESCSLLADADIDMLRVSVMQHSMQRPSVMTTIQQAQQARRASEQSGQHPDLEPGSGAAVGAGSSHSGSTLSALRVPAVEATPASDTRSPLFGRPRAGTGTADTSDDLPTHSPASALFGDATGATSGGQTGALRRIQSASAAAMRLSVRESMDDDNYPRLSDDEEDGRHRQTSRLNSQSVSRRRTVSGFTRSAQSVAAFSGLTGTPRHKSGAVKADEMLRMLSMAHRGENALIQQELLDYVRAIFLEILRVRYWHDIEKGKIPRQSHSAKFLLYSVEVAVDKVEQRVAHSAQDWLVIRKEITELPLSIRMLAYFDEHFPHLGPCGYSTYYLGKLEARREKRAVYMLTSFIDAHQHAQAKVHEFISSEEEEDGEGERVQSPEELKVIEESKQAVEAAQHLLNAMSADTVSKIRSKQAAALVLTKQAELIKTMVGEGLLTQQQAEEFLEEIGDDLQRMNHNRDKMYWEQGEVFAQKRQALRRDRMTDSFAGRYSVFSLFDWQKRRPEPEGQDVKEEIYLGPNSITSSATEPLMQAVGGSDHV